MASDEAVEGVPAPLSHLALLLIAVLPLFANVPTNVNIVITAAATVFCGCWRSVKPEPPSEAMTRKDAMKFPLVGSVILFSLFLAFKFLPKDLVNLVLSLYFVLLGTAALVATADPLVASAVPKTLKERSFEIRIPSIPKILPEGMEFSFTLLETILALPAAGLCWWYWTTRHWAGNNALGFAFSLQGIEHLSLGAVQNGVILLTGLFFYDIFWVFFTPVMVSVAKSFDAPIKLLFPRIDAGVEGPQFSMLGLGDIVIPGIFVALILRYDMMHSGRPRFFASAFAGYVAGLIATIAVMNAFKAAQPALLYIVPAVLMTTFAHAVLVGQAGHLFHWKEADEEAEKEGAKPDGKAVDATQGEQGERRSGRLATEKKES